MNKRLIKPAVSILLCVLLLSGCGNNKSNSGNTETTEDRALDDYQFLIEILGCTPEELDNLDVIEFVETLGLRTDNGSTVDVHELIATLKEDFVDDGTSDIFMITTAEGGGKISDGVTISKIGFIESSGNNPETRAVFDLEKELFYLRETGTTPYELTKEQAESLSDITDRNHVSTWESVTNGGDNNTTGSYGWKLVFQDTEGTYYVYSGYTPDSGTFPETYSALAGELKSILDSALSD